MLTKIPGKVGMMVDGQIEGSSISWKIDTGARCTFITEECYRNILPDSRPMLRPVDTRFITASGGDLKVLGTAVMTLSFDEFCVQFPIIVGGVRNNLLGENFLQSFRCEWDWDSLSLEISGRNIPFHEQNECVRSSRVVSLETVTVPAKHEIVHYLLGRKFTIRTDHGSLTWLYRFREPDGQISRWIQQISAYDFKIVHRPGKKHSNADALSRIKIKEQDFCTQCKLPWDYEFEAPPKQDETEEPVVIAPVNKINTEVDNSFNVPIKRGSKPNTPKRAQAKKQPDITLTPSLIHEMQSQDTELGDVLKLKLDSAVKPTFENFTNQNGTKRWKICTPKALQGYVLWHLHDSPTGGHQGINRTKKRAALCPFFWPHMNLNIQDYVETCDICEERKQPARSKRQKMKSYVMGTRFQRLASDIAGPLPTTEQGNRYILVIQDYFTKFTEVYPLCDINAETVANVFLKGWIKRYGCPVGNPFRSGDSI
ncbi:unnamed protein product [Mytilus edulis]|uniref:Reverse transcriptase n=1 Tax=Mytilus edulis TaxID=6550 RepID=A0A8S3QRT8_MYTED|nr:unnamed protein product [Mytilus edulis]